MTQLTRRTFLTGAAMLFPAPYQRLAAALRKKVKITDVKCMIVRGTWDWNLIKIETDSGVYGIGEAYWGPGVKDLVLTQMKPILVGEDPLNVDKLYTKMLMEQRRRGRDWRRHRDRRQRHRDRALGPGGPHSRNAGVQSARRPVSRPRPLLSHPAGGGATSKIRAPGGRRSEEVRSEKFGWTAFKFQGDGVPPKADPEFREPGHDPYSRNLTAKDIRRIVKGMETVREELGPDIDFAIECHWRYDVRDVIELAKALEHVKPMWLEDPVPPENPEAMARVTHAVDVPICTGENLYTRHGFRKLIELQACDAVHIDIPKSGGLLESKRISDMADLYYIWTAAHNPASPLGTIASAHAASSMRSFRIHELAKYIDWWQDLVIHEGPIFDGGYLTIQDKPGYGVEINPDVAKAHLAPGETWWG